MGERRWTEEQLSAINTRDKTLLVSAAAGSGKTATLTERIIRQLTDSENPIGIDSLLVVTFTNAAAAELRAKISRALAEAVEKSPENKTLRDQLYLLPSAKIRTIDSFCNDILKNNCDRVGVPPNYRIADTAEGELLAISILEGLIEAVYNGELPEVASPEEFEQLADCLTDSKRTEELCEVFRVVHAKCEDEEKGTDSLLELIKNYENPLPVEENAYGAYLLARVREMAEHYAAAIRKKLSVFSPECGSEDKYIPVAESDLALMKKLLAAKTYSEMREVLTCAELVRMPGGKKEVTDNMLSYAAMRDLLKEDVKEYSAYFTYTEEMWVSLFEGLHRLFTVLYRFVSLFDKLFLEEKRQRGALSYADIERYTYNCLVKDGEPTDIALNLRAQFSAVYIDEYQDVNSLQNRIFEVISRPTGRFMVGDIKQSIYGFRSARPEIFSSMKSSFPRLSDGCGDYAAVFMSSNFRCDRPIVDFVNGIFDRAFSLVGESIGYEAGDRLGYAKIHDGGEPEYRKPEICLVDKSSASDDKDAGGAPEVVAKKIAELLASGRLDNGEPIHPSDIAIIMRNAKGKDERYVEALTALGIPSCISEAKDFFLSPEVLLALCLLNSIDNPSRDIYLAGLMCSPLFGFTPDELCAVRGEFKRGTLYESLSAYTAAHSEFSKGKSFIERLNYYRTLSEGIGVGPLIYKLYHETGLYALAARNGGKDNLMLLYDYARKFEAGAFKGLYNFISFLNNLIDKKTTFDDPREGGETDAVKIITCHSSKGLEYPVVFLVDATSRISNKEKKNRLAYSDGFGIAMRLRTPSGLAVVNNPVIDIVNHRIERKNYEEELRVLYVALTRARERLFVVGTSPNEKREAYTSKIDVLREDLSKYSVRTLSSMMEVVLVCGECGTPCYSEAFVSSPSQAEQPELDSSPRLTSQAQISEEEKRALTAELVRRFTYQYPAEHLTRLPEKMSVSRMSPTILDGTESESASLESREGGRRRLPAFADGGRADESAKRGIATHYFLQFCDLDLLDGNGAERELERLRQGGFISDADAERVRLDEIEAFRKSELYRIMRGAKKLYREFRFNVRLPASHFTSDEENKRLYAGEDILVQGVIDCIVERGDGSLCLYDYKTDRLTREELADRALAEEKLRASHKMQLTLYSLAAEKIFGKSPEVLEVYSLPLGDTVSMK